MLEPFGYRRTEGIRIENKYELGINSLLRERLVDLIEEDHVPIGRLFFTAKGAFAMVIERIGEPNVGKIHVRLLFQIFHPEGDENLSRFGISVAEVGIEGVAAKAVSDTLDLCEVTLVLLLQCGGLCRGRAHMHAERLKHPAVADIMELKTKLYHIFF